MAKRAGVLAAAVLAAVYLFFAEYLPPFERVQLHSDIDGFHHPLLGYAFRSLMDGRLPQWDPGIYCGISFAGSPPAALFYPPNWLLFAVRAPYGTLTYKSVEAFAFLHVWLAFLLAFGWLRETGGSRLAACLGAGVAAFSGYMCSQITHLGVATGFAWFPLALWGIERARARDSLGPLWMVAAASALVFLAGYPGTWVALTVCAMAYAAARGRWKYLAGAAGALAFSLALVAVQLLPSLDAARLKIPEPVYGGGLWTGVRTYLTFFIPNFFDHSRPLRGVLPTDGEYFYLGAPAIFGLLWLARRRDWRSALPGLAVGGVCLLLIIDPGSLILRAMEAVWPTLRDAVREYSLLAGLPIAAAFLTRVAVDDFLARPPGSTVHRWQVALSVALTVFWCARQYLIWRPGGMEFASGWMASFEPAVTVALFASALTMVRRDRRSRVLAAGLLLLVFADYKFFGTNRRFNADAGNRDRTFRDLNDTRAGGTGMAAMDQRVFDTIRRDPASRVMFLDGLHDSELRFYGFASPQGHDPLLPRTYRDRISGHAAFETSRVFRLDPGDERSLQDFAVRFIICRHDLGTPAKLDRIPHLRRIGPVDTFLQTYEYVHAKPAYRWNGSVQVTEWTPERRVFRVNSTQGGTFALIEQDYPGWTAAVDGRPAAIGLWDGAFQSAQVGAGEHLVVFEFRPVSLRAGAAISGLALPAGLLLWLTALRKPSPVRWLYRRRWLQK